MLEQQNSLLLTIVLIDFIPSSSIIEQLAQDQLVTGALDFNALYLAKGIIPKTPMHTMRRVYKSFVLYCLVRLVASG